MSSSLPLLSLLFTLLAVLPMALLSGFAHLLVASTDTSTWIGRALENRDVRSAVRRLDREYEALTR